jgi:hypothetical protein
MQLSRVYSPRLIKTRWVFIKDKGRKLGLKAPRLGIRGSSNNVASRLNLRRLGLKALYLFNRNPAGTGISKL